MQEKELKDKLICDFCETNEASGVYATDHGPFSSAYCDECLKHPNIRTIFKNGNQITDLILEKLRQRT